MANIIKPQLAGVVDNALANRIDDYVGTMDDDIKALVKDVLIFLAKGYEVERAALLGLTAAIQFVGFNAKALIIQMVRLKKDLDGEANFKQQDFLAEMAQLITVLAVRGAAGITRADFGKTSADQATADTLRNLALKYRVVANIKSDKANRATAITLPRIAACFPVLAFNIFSEVDFAPGMVCITGLRAGYKWSGFVAAFAPDERLVKIAILHSGAFSEHIGQDDKAAPIKNAIRAIEAASKGDSSITGRFHNIIGMNDRERVLAFVDQIYQRPANHADCIRMIRAINDLLATQP